MNKPGPVSGCLFPLTFVLGFVGFLVSSTLGLRESLLVASAMFSLINVLIITMLFLTQSLYDRRMYWENRHNISNKEKSDVKTALAVEVCVTLIVIAVDIAIVYFSGVYAFILS